MENRTEQKQYPQSSTSHDFWIKGLSVWLAVGLLWFLIGIAWAPSTKLYRQGLVLFLWLPTLLCLFSQRQVFQSMVLRNKGIVIPLLLFLLWATISITWSSDDDPSTGVRRIIYVSLFFCATFYLSYIGKNCSPIKLMTVAAYGLALAALLSILAQYVIDGSALSTRLSGIGTIDHPILGGYVMGLMLIWLSATLPQKIVAKLITLAAISLMFLFILFTQSRGLWVALLGVAIVYSMLCPTRHQWAITGVLLLVCLVGYWLFASYIIARGTSHRPEIFEVSVQMIASNPWLGLGLGTDYDITVGKAIFSHSHNLFTHIAIELGLPGLMLWLTVWAYSFKTTWRYRDTPAGAASIKIFIFCTIALLFDGGSLLKSPRPEWFLSWLPIALAISLGSSYAGKKKEADTHNKEHQPRLLTT